MLARIFSALRRDEQGHPRIQPLRPAPSRRQRRPVGHSAFVVQSVISRSPSIPPAHDGLHTADTVRSLRQHCRPAPQLDELEHESASPAHLPIGVQLGGPMLSIGTQHSCVALAQVLMPQVMGRLGGPASTAIGPSSAMAIASSPGGKTASLPLVPVSLVVPTSPSCSSSPKSSMVRAPQPDNTKARRTTTLERLMPGDLPYSEASVTRNGIVENAMSPYRSAELTRSDPQKPWPLPVLFAAALIAWWLVEHAIGSIGRF